MRKSGKRSAGYGRGLLLAASAVGVLVVGGLWPDAAATPSRVDTLAAVLTSPVGPSRKAIEIEELRTIDSTSARNKLKDLADSGDERLALLAIRALGRCSWSGAKSKIAEIYEDTSRSDVVRATALAVWCQMESTAGRSWANGKSWVKNHAATNQRLRDQYAASKSRHWASEVDNDQ
jgi:hypothetical protein